MNKTNNTYDLLCDGTKEIEKLYSQQSIFTYGLMIFSVFTFSLLIVLVP